MTLDAHLRCAGPMDIFSFGGTYFLLHAAHRIEQYLWLLILVSRNRALVNRGTALTEAPSFPPCAEDSVRAFTAAGWVRHRALGACKWIHINSWRLWDAWSCLLLSGLVTIVAATAVHEPLVRAISLLMQLPPPFDSPPTQESTPWTLMEDPGTVRSF